MFWWCLVLTVLDQGGQVFTLVLSRRKLRGSKPLFRSFKPRWNYGFPLWISKGRVPKWHSKGYDINKIIEHVVRTFQLDPPLFPRWPYVYSYKCKSIWPVQVVVQKVELCEIVIFDKNYGVLNCGNWSIRVKIQDTKIYKNWSQNQHLF